MADFMLRANIAHFKELLAIETDAVKIAMLRRLRSPLVRGVPSFHGATFSRN
ncbi:hypothetical protein ACQPTN_09040 [Bradyrhizobium sp. 13971]